MGPPSQGQSILVKDNSSGPVRMPQQPTSAEPALQCCVWGLKPDNEGDLFLSAHVPAISGALRNSGGTS